jgi:hypothetical protein
MWQGFKTLKNYKRHALNYKRHAFAIFKTTNAML